MTAKAMYQQAINAREFKHGFELLLKEINYISVGGGTRLTIEWYHGDLGKLPFDVINKLQILGYKVSEKSISWGSSEDLEYK